MHSPEPWKITDKWRVVDANGRDIERDCADGLDRGDLLRAVACVNACRGLNPEAVPELVAVLDDLLDYADGACDEGFGSAQEQSDGMKAACEKAKELLGRVKV